MSGTSVENAVGSVVDLESLLTESNIEEIDDITQVVLGYIAKKKDVLLVGQYGRGPMEIWRDTQGFIRINNHTEIGNGEILTSMELHDIIVGNDESPIQVITPTQTQKENTMNNSANTAEQTTDTAAPVETKKPMALWKKAVGGVAIVAAVAGGSYVAYTKFFAGE